MKVFVPRAKFLDREKAEKYGELVVLSNDKTDSNYGLEPDRIKMQIAKEMIAFDAQKDYLLLDQGLIYNMVASGIISLFHKKIKVLLWNRSEYVSRVLELPFILRGKDDIGQEQKTWAANECHHIGKGDYSYLTKTDDDYTVLEAGKISEIMSPRLDQMKRNDILLPSGTPIINVFAIMYLIQKYGSYQIMIKDHRSKSFVSRDLSIDMDQLVAICK